MAYRVFGYTPDGAAMLERLTFNTDINTGSNGTEHRRRLRSRPRYRYEYTLAASDQHGNGYLALLDDLRAWQGDWLIPLWPHAVDAPNTPARALSSTVPALAFNSLGHADEYSGAPPVGSRTLVPAGLGRIVEARKITHATDTFAMATVAVELYNHDETVPAYDLVDADGVATFDFPVDWSNGASEELTPDENRVDFDGLWLAETRYRTRTLTVPVFLDGEAQINRFRAFVFHVQGAYKAFKATPAPDKSEGLWRLNSDTVEISHVAPGFATAALTFKQL